jgi:hypothetical protein
MKTNYKLKSKEKIEEERQGEFLKAKKSLQEMQKIISPYIKKRRVKDNSTADKWCESSNIYVC